MMTTLLFLSLFGAPELQGEHTINSIVGDRSWIESTGESPRGDEDDVERIQVHLRFVIDELRSADTYHLDERQHARRGGLLSALERYAEAGTFPSHDRTVEGRRPRFVDHLGVHCAVGYLMSISGYDDLVARIQQRFEYAYIQDITTDGVMEWARDHGFSLQELAMIQPGYPYRPGSSEDVRAIPITIEEFQARIQRAFVPGTIRRCLKEDDFGSFTLRAKTQADPDGMVSSKVTIQGVRRARKEEMESCLSRLIVAHARHLVAGREIPLPLRSENNVEFKALRGEEIEDLVLNPPTFARALALSQCMQEDGLETIQITLLVSAVMGRVQVVLDEPDPERAAFWLCLDVALATPEGVDYGLFDHRFEATLNADGHLHRVSREDEEFRQ